MPQPFFQRLKAYYLEIGRVLRGEAAAANIFPNSGDVGVSRERLYIDFLKQHVPSKCEIFLGGYLFDESGAESKQLDVIITTDTTPRFNFFNRGNGGRSFAPVEGTLGVVTVKSTLNLAEVTDALSNLASIPPTKPTGGRNNPAFSINNYEDWPYKVVYASNGVRPETLLSHVKDFYATNPDIPVHRRANMIHVAGSCLIVRIESGHTIIDRATGTETKVPEGSFELFTTDPDLQAITGVLTALQEAASASTQMFFQYHEIMNRVKNLP